jgi:hypothetical protein
MAAFPPLVGQKHYRGMLLSFRENRPRPPGGQDMIGRGTAYGRRLCFTSLVTEHPRASLKRFGKRYKEKRRLN